MQIFISFINFLAAFFSALSLSLRSSRSLLLLFVGLLWVFESLASLTASFSSAEVVVETFTIEDDDVVAAGNVNDDDGVASTFEGEQFCEGGNGVLFCEVAPSAGSDAGVAGALIVVVFVVWSSIKNEVIDAVGL